MCGIHWVIYSAMIISLLAKVRGDTSVEKVAATTGANIKLIIDTVNPANLPFDAVRMEYNDVPCTCVNLTCSCCFGLNIVALNFADAACTKATAVPDKFALDFVVSVGDLTIMSRRLSAENLPSMCDSLQHLPMVSLCLRASDVRFIDNKLNACIDLETKLADSTIAVMRFKCFALGSEGLEWKEP